MRLNNNTIKDLNVGDSIFYDGKECLVKDVWQSKIDTKRWFIDVERIEDKLCGELELSDVYNSEVIQGKSWKTRMKHLMDEILKMKENIDKDQNRYFDTENENCLDDFQISYNGKTIKIPLYLAGFFNPVWDLLDGCLEEADEQLG